MIYPTNDTEWATSAKGNTWKPVNGVPLIVGKRKDGRWWARREESFLSGSFCSKIQAMNAAEIGFDGENISDHDFAEGDE